ncbi:MAG TPA: hypothetical protein EYQ83_00450, partial [Acidobacteria bacterium]|nr:hypothetical protein [Acidobacteriota bacterium]
MTARTLVGALVVVAGTGVSAQESDLIAPGAKVERLAGGFGFLEGPAADADGALYFSDFYNDTSRRTNQVTGSIYRISRRDETVIAPPVIDL